MITSKIKGVLRTSKTSTFTDDSGKDVLYGKIQIESADASGEFIAITNVKVKKDNFGKLPDLAKNIGKLVHIELSQNSYDGKISYYFENYSL